MKGQVRGERDIGAKREIIAMGEIHDLERAEGQRQADPPNGDDRSYDDPVEHDLGKLIEHALFIELTM